MDVQHAPRLIASSSAEFLSITIWVRIYCRRSKGFNMTAAHDQKEDRELESEYQQTSRLNALSRGEFEQFAAGVESALHRIESRLDAVSQQQRIPTTALMSGMIAIATFFAILSGGGWALIQFSSAAKTAPIVESIKHIKQDIYDLDENLQREMRDLDAINETRITNLDKILQREFSLSVAPIAARVEALEGHVDRIEAQSEGFEFKQIEREQVIRERITRLEATQFTTREAKAFLDRLARIEEQSSATRAEQIRQTQNGGTND